LREGAAGTGASLFFAKGEKFGVVLGVPGEGVNAVEA